MKIKVFYLALLLLVCLLPGCSKKNAPNHTGESVFSSFTAADIHGNPVDQRVFADAKLTMVNIWATFCSPCISEMSDLAALSTAFGEDFQVVGIVIDAADRNGNIYSDKMELALSIIEDTGANYLHLLPSPSLHSAYLKDVQAIPVTIFVDASGRQIGETYLGAKSHGQWESIIKTLLKSIS